LLQSFWTWETAIVLGLLALAFTWAARQVQRASMTLPVRAFREDVWRALVPERGTPVFLDIIDRYEFDEGSDRNGIMVFKNGMRLRFETSHVQKEGDIWQAAWRSVEINKEGKPSADPYETLMKLRDAQDGAVIDLEYVFVKGEAGGWKVWLGRLMRPLMKLSAGSLLRSSIEKSGGFARYEGEHGPPSTPAMVAGVPLTRNSLLLFGLGAGSFMWMSGVWIGFALLVILVLHELGHVIAMRAYGDKTSAFYLVPFMGGVAIGQKPLKSDWSLIIMVLAGPFAGLLTALGAIGLFHLTDNDWLIAIAYMAVIVNLLNLLPIPFLDGGQVFMALLRRYLPGTVIHWLGIALLLAAAAAFAWLGSTLMLVLFGLLAAMQAAFPTPANANSREPLSHAGAAAGAILLIALAAALIWVARLIVNGDAYPGNPLGLLGLGPFT
jgi:Zn-dependent protease